MNKGALIVLAMAIIVLALPAWAVPGRVDLQYVSGATTLSWRFQPLGLKPQEALVGLPSGLNWVDVNVLGLVYIANVSPWAVFDYVATALNADGSSNTLVSDGVGLDWGSNSASFNLASYNGEVSMVFQASGDTYWINTGKVDFYLNGKKLLFSGDKYALNLGGTAGASPQIEGQPASQTVTVGSAAIFTVGASDATLYRWYKDDQELSGDYAAGSILTINDVRLADAGSYTVKVSNDFGWVMSDAAVLTVTGEDIEEAPEITGQSNDQSVMVGIPAHLTVVATGDNLAYQWYVKNEVGDYQKIDGAQEGEYEFTSQEEGVWWFYCQVSNGTGSVESVPARVVVENDSQRLPAASIAGLAIMCLAVVLVAGGTLCRRH